MKPRARIVGAGARSSLGRSLRQVAMGARARHAGVGPTPLGDTFDPPVPLSVAPDLPDDLCGLDRMVALAAPALLEAHAQAPHTPVPVILALPDLTPMLEAEQREAAQNKALEVASQTQDEETSPEPDDDEQDGDTLAPPPGTGTLPPPGTGTLPPAGAGDTLPPPGMADDGMPPQGFLEQAPPPSDLQNAMPSDEESSETPAEEEEAEDAGFQPRDPQLRSGAALLADLAKVTGIDIDIPRSMIVEHGHAGGALAFDAAVHLLSQAGRDTPPVVIVGGVDTHYWPVRLRQMVEERRNYQPRRKGGLVPAEAAAFVALAPPETEVSRGPTVDVTAIETLNMPRSFDPTWIPENPEAPPPKPKKGERPKPENMAELLKEVLEDDRPTKWFLTDVNGQRRRISAWAHVMKELGDHPAVGEGAQHDAMGGRVGDVGAASAVLYAAIAYAWWTLRGAFANELIIAVHSDLAERGLVQLTSDAALDRSDDVLAPRAVAQDSKTRSPARAPARAARRIAARLRWQHRKVAHRFRVVDRPLVDHAIAELERACEVLEFSEPTREAHLDDLEAAAKSAEELARVSEVALGRAFKRYRKGHLAEIIHRTANQIGQALREIRPAVVDRVAAAAEASTVGDPPPEPKAELPPGIASVGTPQVYAFPWEGHAEPTAPVDWEDMEEPPKLPDEQVDDGFGEDLYEEEEDETAEELVAADADAPEPEEAGLPAHFTPPPPPDEGPTDAAFPLVKDALEAIGRISALRRAGGQTLWSPALAEFEQRMLNQLDYLYALAVPELHEPQEEPGTTAMSDSRASDLLDVIAAAAPVERGDPDVAFARSFVLSCAAGRDGARWAVAGLPHAPGYVLNAHADALRLASGERVAPAVEELCNDPNPKLVELALDVLRARREVRLGLVAPLLRHPSPSIRGAAARAVVVVRRRESAIEVLESEFAREPDPVVAHALMEGLVRLGAPHALQRLRIQMDALAADQRGPYLPLLAIAGRGEDFERLAASTQRAEDLVAWGWFGRGTVVEPLIRLLSDSPERRKSAAIALQRVTGMVPKRDVDSRERAMHPERVLEDGDMSAASVARLEEDPAVWQAWWANEGARFGLSSRYRFGRDYESRASLVELSEVGVSAEDRHLAALEYQVASRGETSLPDQDDWVARQLAVVSALLAEDSRSTSAS